MKQQFPNLRVVAISPPGGFISWRMATECKDFVTSFVLDSDLVPRLSHHSMEQLRDEVLEMISRIKVPKMQVVRTFVVNGILRSHKETTDPEKLAHDNAKILHSKENIPTDTEFYRQMEKFKAIQQERKDKRGEYRNISLFPPGNMIHLVKIDERRSCLQTIAKCVTCCTSNAGYQYTPVYVNNDDFDEITITPTMGFDHFPNRVCLELERVAEAFGIDTSLGSSKRDHENAERMRLDTNSVF
jgi:sn1-specific diacylglycerol lipase